MSRIQNVISETKSYRNNQEVCTFYLAKIQEENSSLHSAESRCVLYCHCAPSSFFPKSSLQNWVNQQSWTFLFVKTDSWICQHLFDSRFREISLNFSSFEDLLFQLIHLQKSWLKTSSSHIFTNPESTIFFHELLSWIF